jgi:hypothetical protein
MRQFIEVTELTTGERMMLGMAHIARISPTGDGCYFEMDKGPPIIARESYARIAAILGGMPSEIVDMMEEDDRWRQGR